MEEKKILDELVDLMMHEMMHDVLHLPIKGYGFEGGKQVLTKEVHRRKKGCPKCDELYKDLPIPIERLK